MQFMIVGIQILYKLQVHIKFFFASYKNNKIKAYQKV